MPLNVGELGPLEGDRQLGPRPERHEGDDRHHEGDGDGDDRPDHPVRALARDPESRGEPAQDEHEGDEGDEFDEDLGEREVGCPVQREHRGHAESGDADEHDGLEPLSRPRRRDGRDDHHERDRELGGVVPQAQLGGPASVCGEGAADDDDEHEQDHAEVEGEGSALGEAREPGREAID